MSSSLIKFDGTKDLATLQKLVSQTESIVGPLIALTILDNQSFLVFEAGNPPNPASTLTKISSEPAPPQNGKPAACSGGAIVNGKSVLVAAYR